MNKRDKIEEMQKKLEYYFRLLKCRYAYVDNFYRLIQRLIKNDKREVLVVKYLLFRKIAFVFGRKAYLESDIEKKAEQFLAIVDMYHKLSEKNVSCYFFNRVGMIKEFPYSEEAFERIKKKLSFPKMYEDREKYEKEFKEILKDSYSVSYVEELGKIPQVVKRGEVYGHEDCSGGYVNVVGGQRITVDYPKNPKRGIHIYGRCGVFGYAVEDKDTLPSQLQKLFLKEYGEEYGILNYGLWGGEDFYIYHNFIFNEENIKENDIVIFYMHCDDKQEMEILKEYGVYYYDITDEYHKAQESKWCFYDKPGHMTKEGYRIVSQLIFHKLKETEFKPKGNSGQDIKNIYGMFQYRMKYLSTKDDVFLQDLKQYLKEIKQRYPLENDNATVGAIVMNCNPFTLGHRYLIEYAEKKVERLYIFILEEDKSFFKFNDRFRMVQAGVSDLKKVIVLPSKEFIISASTFPEYFMKDYLQEKEIDVSKDVSIFGKYIAKELNITVRFVGEEPIDLVTRQYNEGMKRILPQYGVLLEEIPRKCIHGENVISASKVRKLMKENSWDQLLEYVPKTTYDYLIENYSRGKKDENR